MKANQLKIGQKFLVSWLGFCMTMVAYGRDYIEAKDDDGQTLFIHYNESVWTADSNPYAF